MGIRKYKIHVKREKSQKIKKCRGFKRLIFKSFISCHPELISDEYIKVISQIRNSRNKYTGVSLVGRSKLNEYYNRRRSIIDYLFNDIKIYKEVVRLLIKKEISVSVKKIISSNYSVSVYDVDNNKIRFKLKNNNLITLTDDNDELIINFQVLSYKYNDIINWKPFI